MLRTSIETDRKKVLAATAVIHHMAKIRLTNLKYMMMPEDLRDQIGPLPRVDYP